MLTQLVREQPHQTAPFADHVSIPGMNKLIPPVSIGASKLPGKTRARQFT